ncbi:hypothetical protein LASUN_10590 [Lentilactobacillus sunkii]|jgi:hypothetical protein|uniref:Uncharacterized protein n=1 Tax=Lentilactobacillus sunkii TaxID=481719 RepID=A0A1E7XEA6_9LACO|nr:hypothetical protein [Lentilactobacillus sunkii]OFA11450.1 hypothetical protein LASUN_10590 [Lentilactobacillus sunkii]
MKTKTMIATVLLTAGLGFGAVSITASAASWHKGSPKFTRGIWNDSYKYPKGAMCDGLSISSHLLVMDDNSPHLSNLHYKVVGHHEYRFRGYEFELRRYQTTCKFHWFNKHHVRFYEDNGYGGLEHIDLYKVG